MGRSHETFSKKEREKKRQKKRKDKAEKKAERRELKKAEGGVKKTLEEMFMYVDEDGNLTSTPPDPLKKEVINLEDIQISVPKKEDREVEERVRTGTVKFFNEEKGFGFIIDNKSKENIFVGERSLSEPITANDVVSFEVEMGQKGPTAVNVSIAKT